MQQHESKCFVHKHTLDTWDGVKRPKHILSESHHAAYQIKGNRALKHLADHILRALSVPQAGSNHFFLKVVMLHNYQIKGNRT